MVDGGAVVLDDYADMGGGVLRAVHEHVARTGQQVFAGPVVQAVLREGVLAKDRNRRGVVEDLSLLVGDKPYVTALRTVARWLEQDQRKVQALVDELGSTKA